MAWTDSETKRVIAIENLLNTLQEYMRQLVGKANWRQGLLLNEKRISDLETRVSSLESQIQVLQTKL